MDRDQDNHQWLPNNNYSAALPSSSSSSTADSLLHQFHNLSLSSTTATGGAAHRRPPPPPPPHTYANNYSSLFSISNAPISSPSNPWIDMSSSLHRDFPAPNYSPLELHTLRIDSGSSSASSYSSLDLGLPPTRMDYAALLMRSRSILANGGDHVYGSNMSSSYNPTDLLERSLLNTWYANKTFNRRLRHNNHNRNHNYHSNNDNNNCVNNGGWMNSQSTMDTKLPTWEEVRNKIATLAVHERGSTILQSMLDKGGGGIDIPVSEVKIHIAEIVSNEFGISFLHKLAQACSERHAHEIIGALMGNKQLFLKTCLNSRGTFAVQKLLYKINPNDSSVRSVVASAVVPNASRMSKNHHGNYVVNSCLKVFEGFNDVIAPILEEIGNNCLEIAMDKSGCCVLQQCLAQPELQVGHQRLLNVIISHAYELSQHEYGNYVVQFVIGMRNEITNTQVIQKLEGSFSFLSKSKYGSHVIEKCLKDTRDEQVKLIIKELCDDPNFLEIVLHPWGNYVAQTALHRSKALSGYSEVNPLHQMLVERIQRYSGYLNLNIYGRKVLSHTKCKCRVEDFGFNMY